MKKTVLHAAIFAMTMPMSLYAIGLGEMKVKSALDQPFSAEIELIDVGSTPLSGIKVGLADPENFEQVGIERTAILSLLSFKIQKNAHGKYVIVVQSIERMTEPYMELVVDLAWPKGQLYKAYSILLDPPGYRLVSSTAQSSQTHYKRVNKHTYEPGVVNKTIITSVQRNPVELNDNKKKATYGPTISNENVWQIAQRYKTSDVILPQVVLAIVGANPTAFNEGNLNGLKVGVRLVIPATPEIMQIPADLATEEVMAHDKAWNEKTAINHVLSPPYMNKQTVNPQTINPPTANDQVAMSGQKTNPDLSINNSKIPTIPKLIIQPEPSQESLKSQESLNQLIPATTALPIVNTTQQQSVPTATKPQSMEQYSIAKAELSITTAAIESVRESNAVLMEQLHLLQAQNKKLQEQLDKREKELEVIHSRMEVLVKERLAIAAQASSSNTNNSSFGYWPLFLLLIVAAGGGGFAYWYFRLRKQENNESPYLTDNKDAKSSVPLVEPVSLKGEDESVSEPVSEKNVKEDKVEVSTSNASSQDKDKNSVNKVDSEVEDKIQAMTTETSEKPVKKHTGRKKKMVADEPLIEMSSQPVTQEVQDTDDKKSSDLLEKSIEPVDYVEIKEQSDNVATENQSALEETKSKDDAGIVSESAIEKAIDFEPVGDIEQKVKAQPDNVDTESQSSIEETKLNDDAGVVSESVIEKAIDFEPVGDLESKVKEHADNVGTESQSSSNESKLNDDEVIITDSSLIDSASEEESSDHDLLEFESGLHESLQEKPKPQALAEKTEEHEDMSIEFVPSQSDVSIKEDEDSKGVKQDKVEDNDHEDLDTNQEFNLSLEHDESQLKASDTVDSELDKSITDFFVEPAEDKVISADVEQFGETSSNQELETKNQASNPLKSTKALNTLLDLAKTYIGMEDYESARHSLEEVLEYGSETQKEEAQRLLTQIKDN